MNINKTARTKSAPAVFKAVALVSIISIITRIFSFVFKIYLSRAYGAEAVGLYQTGISVFFLFAALSASGLPLVVSRKVAEFCGDKTKEFSLVSSAMLLGLSVCVFLIAAFALFPALFNLLFTDKRVVPIFRIMLPALFSTTVYCIIRGWFWGKKNFLVFGFTELLEEIFRIIFSVLLAGGMIASISGATGIAAAFLISDAASAITLFALYFARGGKFVRPKDIKAAAKSALPVTAMRVFGNIIGSLSAIIIPARLVAAGMDTGEATAEFGRVSGMAIPLLLAPLAVIGSIAVVLIPELASDSAADNTAVLNEKINKALTASILISGIFLSVYLPFGREVGTLLYNDAGAGLYLRYAALLMLPIGVNQISATVLNSVGKEGGGFVNFVIGTAVMIVLIVILPQYIGIYAVAVGTGACYIVTSALNIRLLKKKTGMRPTFFKPLILVLAFSGPCSFIAVWLRNIAASRIPETAALFLCIAAAATLYLLFLWCFDLADISRFMIVKRKKPRVKPALKPNARSANTQPENAQFAKKQQINAKYANAQSILNLNR
ncbi:MAG: oligosaccharide flippase family protein [Clostridiales bacterium]|jgi:stage V sporulation protein B|nr:oligosaccharide flippase family protein [Clostridiales bacterium]